MTTQPDKPKRGPGRPRKNPAPAPPAPEQTPDPASDLDWPQLIYEAMVERGSPATAAEVSELTEMPVAEVTEILDALVSQGRLVLDTVEDAERYSLPLDEHLSSEPDLQDDEPEKLRVASVAIPTSSIYAFLNSLNLPPEYLRGLGSFSGLSGTLYFEALEPTDEDPRPSGALKVRIEGTHTRVAPALNPNQPGYVADIVPTAAVTEAPE